MLVRLTSLAIDLRRFRDAQLHVVREVPTRPREKAFLTFSSLMAAQDRERGFGQTKRLHLVWVLKEVIKHPCASPLVVVGSRFKACAGDLCPCSASRVQEDKGLSAESGPSES